MALLPALAVAQDEGDTAETEATEATEAASDEEGTTGEESSDEEAAPRKVAASGYATTEQPFKARRGFSTEGEFGIFNTLGGRDTSNPAFPETVSNVAPYIAIIFGYDVFSNDSFALSLGPKIGVAFSDGASRLSTADVEAGADGSTFVNDYAAYEAGLNVSLIFMVAERLSITGKLNGGVVFVDSNPNVDFCGFNSDNPNPGPTPQPGNDPADFRAQCGNSDAGDLSIGGMFGASAGVEWYTLLNGFSVGLQVRFQGLLVDGFIPGLAVPITLKYNF